MTDDRIEWDEPREPERVQLLVSIPGPHYCGIAARPATIDDLRRACVAAGLHMPDAEEREITRGWARALQEICGIARVGVLPGRNITNAAEGVQRMDEKLDELEAAARHEQRVQSDD